jgi:fructose-1,6-bisphosphatase/inositol monophosphatase family enzyme
MTNEDMPGSIAYGEKRLRGMVAEAITIIREEEEDIRGYNKTHYDGVTEDRVTNGDYRAQRMYVKRAEEFFPGHGIIAEEDGLRIPCGKPDDDGNTYYLTVDGIDGTKAYERRQSHGIGTMIAWVGDYGGSIGKIVIAAYVGNVTTGEIFSTECLRSHYRFGKQYYLKPKTAYRHDPPKNNLGNLYLLLRKPPWEYPPIIQEMMGKPGTKSLFKSIEIGSGSIGLHMARLWTGEVGGVVLSPGFKTPWDETPVRAINKKLGFVSYRIREEEPDRIQRYEPPIITEIEKRNFTEIIIHQSLEHQLTSWNYQRNNPK